MGKQKQRRELKELMLFCGISIQNDNISHKKNILKKKIYYPTSIKKKNAE